MRLPAHRRRLLRWLWPMVTSVTVLTPAPCDRLTSEPSQGFYHGPSHRSFRRTNARRERARGGSRPRRCSPPAPPQRHPPPPPPPPPPSPRHPPQPPQH